MQPSVHGSRNGGRVRFSFPFQLLSLIIDLAPTEIAPTVGSLDHDDHWLSPVLSRVGCTAVACATQTGTAGISKLDRLTVGGCLILHCLALRARIGKTHTIHADVRIGRMILHEPVGEIEAANVLFDQSATAGPFESMPIAELEFEFRLPTLTGKLARYRDVAGRLHEEDIANCTGMKLRDRLLEGRVVAAFETGNNAQASLLGILGGLSEAERSGGIDRTGPRAVSVSLESHRRFEMRWAEARWGGEDHRIDVGC